MDAPLPPAGPFSGRGTTRIMPRAAAAAIVLGMIVFFLIPLPIVLAVRPVKTGEAVFCAWMADGEGWTLSYVHSVNRRPVYDDLRVEGRLIRIVRSRFDSFGAGIPDTATPDHPLVRGADGRFEYRVDRLVPDVSLFVGRVAGHVLHLKGREIPLASLARPGEALRFSIERQTCYQFCKGGCVW